MVGSGTSNVIAYPSSNTRRRKMTPSSYRPAGLGHLGDVADLNALSSLRDSIVERYAASGMLAGCFQPRRTRIIVDGQNLLCGLTEHFGDLPRIDFCRLHDIMTDGIEADEDDTRFYVGRLARSKIKRAVVQGGFSLQECWKDADTAIAADCMEVANDIDAINICTGDCDVIDLCQRLHRKGVVVNLIYCSVRKPSRSLRQRADRVICFPPEAIVAAVRTAA